MAVIKPFSALRPDSSRAREICELPYDVLSSDEARKIASGNSVSFFHVSKPVEAKASPSSIHEKCPVRRGRLSLICERKYKIFKPFYRGFTKDSNVLSLTYGQSGIFEDYKGKYRGLE